MARMWLGCGSDVARMSLGCRSDVASDVFSDVAEKVWQKLRERGFQHPDDGYGCVLILCIKGPQFPNALLIAVFRKAGLCLRHRDALGDPMRFGG